VVNVPVDRKEQKQKIIIILDFSGSMHEEFKQDWVNAILIDRFKYVMKGEAEVFFSYFIHNPEHMHFQHICRYHLVTLPATERFMNFELDVFQIMPNHIHGIISLTTVGSRLALDPENSIEENPVASGLAPDVFIIDGQPIGLPQRLTQQKKPSIPDIVGAYKSIVANGCLEIYKSRDEVMGKFWQRNYYEHIIRNEFAYYNISEYIINNPIKWEEDRFYFPKI
jgi:REP element-mobilizing transposase RayT